MEFGPDSRVLICGSVHEGSHVLISLFSPYMLFLAIFLTKLKSSLDGPILGSHSMGRGSLIFEGATPIKQ
jgi:hypothetical protein